MSRYYSKDQDISFVMTTHAEEKALFIKAKKGDEVAREFLIRNHLLFARTRAKAMLKDGLPDDETTSAANMAVMKAFKTFDPNRGTRFTTHLRGFIRGEVASLLRSKYSCGILDPSARASFCVTSKSVARIRKVRSGLDDGFAEKPYEANSVLAVVDESLPTVEEIDLKKFNRLALAQAMAKLPKRDAEFLRLYYVEDWNYDRISKRYKMTRQGVQVVHARSIEKLRRWLKRGGVECAS